MKLIKSATNLFSAAVLIGLASLISVQTIQAQVPTINSFSPGFGPVGATVILIGKNFSPIASSNIVWFGAVAAPVTSAQSTQLMVNVPINASQSPISVNGNGLVCAAPSAFVVTYPNAGNFSTSSLASAISLPAGNAPVGLQIVDLDGDGKADLVVPNFTDNTISVYRNIGTNGVLTIGSFAPRIDFAVRTQPRQIVVGDIDGDGKRDVLVGNSGESTVSVFRNISNPGAFTSNSFSARVDFATGASPFEIALVDLNEDGKLDLATGNYNGNTLSVLRNTATLGSITTNSFAAKVDFTAGVQSGGLAVRDIDGDAKPDAVLSNDGGTSISILRNTTPAGSATITFAAKVDFATPARPYGKLSIGDLDGDGKQDIAVATYGGGTVSVFKNISTPGIIASNSLAGRIDLATGGSTHAVLVMDITGDGKSDLVAVSEVANTLAVFRNISTNGTLVAGSFATRVDFLTALNPGGVAIGDLDGDGRPDAIAAANFGNVLSIFRNLNGPTAPAITSQPTNQTVIAGTNVSLTVTVTGSQPLTFQWSFNASNLIVGVTNSSLILSNVQPANSGNYSVFITNSAGSVTSSNATLTVVTPPIITVQPADQTILAGSNATFSVTATGNLLDFQWRFNGTTISNATASSYSITNAQSTNVGGYSVVITNLAGSATSVVANLTVLSAPTIVSQPQSQNFLAGTNVTFSVTASGGEPVFPTVTSGTLKLWLKADAGVVTTNGQVAQWQDQSGNGKHASQNDVDRQPLFASNAIPISGRPVVRFDGIQSPPTGDFLQGTGDVGIPDAFTSFMVYSMKQVGSVTGNFERMPVFVGQPGTFGASRGFYVLNDAMCFATWGFDYFSDFTIPTNTYRIWTERINPGRTLVEFFDSTAFSITNINRPISNPSSSPAPGYFVGGLNPQLTTGRNFSGDIAEVIYYQGSLNNLDRLAIENYLKQRYFQAGVGPLAYQWQLNGTNVLGATNASLSLSNAQPVRSGNYTVVITNAAGSITSAPALIKIRHLFPMGNGASLTNEQYSFLNLVNVSFQSSFTNGTTFYTLDGSTPSFTSHSYSGSFVLSGSALLRAITYNADFSQSGESDPVNITITPTYTLSAATAGGGNVVINGTGPFLSNTVVTVTANPSNGWTFLQWLGDASGTNSTAVVNMTRKKSVQAVFGTTLNTTVTGNGSVSVNPVAGLYPYGTVAHLTATPQPGNYFGIWGNAASGNTNPLQFAIISPNPIVSSLFSALSAGQFSLALSVNGSGQATVSPRANKYSSGQNVTLTATPDAGQTFIGWSGDASGTTNPLNVTMNQSRFITATFTKSPRLAVQLAPSTFSSEGLQLILTGGSGEVYSLQKSINLTDWSTISTVTNFYGTTQVTDLPATNSNHQFYRAAQP